MNTNEHAFRRTPTVSSDSPRDPDRNMYVRTWAPVGADAPELPGADQGPVGTAPSDDLRSLAQSWRLEANRYDDDKQVTPAAISRRHANQLEHAAAIRDATLVTLAEAARISGFSTRQLSRLVKCGRVPSLAGSGRPRVAIGDLPRKPGMARGR